MAINLLSIDQIIKRARDQGAYLGHGNPKVHLAYLTKLKLLPQTIRRKTRLPDGQVGDKIQGCYPDYILPLLSQIENLRAKGLTYPQIRYQLNENQAVVTPQASISPNQNLTFLAIGLVLGFLLASTQGNPEFQPLKVTATNSPDVVFSQNLTSSDPIYLIAIPDQNLYKLGKININELR